MRFQKGQTTGPNNVRWSGDKPTPSAGRQRARKLFPGHHVCEIAGCGKRSERHHKDGNTGNNDRSNIAFLCNKHHKEADGRMHRPEFRAAWRARMAGRKLSAEHRRKISDGLRGRQASDATRQKLSASIKAHYQTIGKKTHCPRGHAYTPENTCVRKNGRYACRACSRASSLRHYYAKKEVAA